MTLSATLLPNGKQQFIDQNGVPLASGLVYFYIPSTTTFKTTWVDSGQVTPNANPVALDSRGQAIIYGEGQYRQVVKDNLGNTIWDQLTASTDYGLLQAANNLSDVANAATALANLGGFPTTGGEITGNLRVDGTLTVTGVTALNGGGTSTTPPLGDSSKKIVTTDFLQPFVSVQGTRKRLKGTWVSNTTASWSADQILLQNASGQPALLKTFSKTVNTALTGAGGLDTGTIAINTWYYVYAIYDGTTQNIICSLTATGPALPGIYTHYAYIGTFKTDGSSNILDFIQNNDRTQFVTATPAQMATGGAWPTAVAVSGFIPPTAGIITASVGLSGDSQNGNVYMGSNANYPFAQAGGGNDVNASFNLTNDLVLESSNIYYGATGPSTPTLWCLGYIDNF